MLRVLEEPFLRRDQRCHGYSPIIWEGRRVFDPRIFCNPSTILIVIFEIFVDQLKFSFLFNAVLFTPNGTFPTFTSSTAGFSLDSKLFDVVEILYVRFHNMKDFYITEIRFHTGFLD